MKPFPYTSSQQPLMRSTNATIAVPVYAPVRSRPRHPILSALKAALRIRGTRSQPDFDVIVGDSGPVRAPHETFSYVYGNMHRR